MTAIACSELIAEVELVAKNGAPERRARVLRELADLFRSAAGRLQPAQLRVFDDVLLRLIERSDARALASISATLAGLEPAPVETVRRLARHEDDAVAAPLLTRTTSLADDDLVQIICDRGQQHLLAIAGRPSLSEDITSLVLKRAGKDTARSLVKNPGARFSEKAYAALIAIAERDETVAEAAGLRPDLPVLLVTGGSQGARSLNQAVFGAAGWLRDAGVQVLHVIGPRNGVDAPVTATGVPYVATPYVDRMDLAYAAADFALCRAGAMTCAELTAVGLPAAYVPLPIGNGEQRLNAVPIVQRGGGMLVDDADLTPDWIRDTLLPVLVNIDQVADMSEAAASLGRGDADRWLAEAVIEVVDGKGRSGEPDAQEPDHAR